MPHGTGMNASCTSCACTLPASFQSQGLRPCSTRPVRSPWPRYYCRLCSPVTHTSKTTREHTHAYMGFRLHCVHLIPHFASQIGRARCMQVVARAERCQTWYRALKALKHAALSVRSKIDDAQAHIRAHIPTCVTLRTGRTHTAYLILLQNRQSNLLPAEVSVCLRAVPLTGSWHTYVETVLCYQTQVGL